MKMTKSELIVLPVVWLQKLAFVMLQLSDFIGMKKSRLAKSSSGEAVESSPSRP